MNGNDLNGEASRRPLFFVEACYVCGALINQQTPWKVSVHWGDRRFKGDEVCVTPVATEVGFCKGCYAELVEEGRLVVGRRRAEVVLTTIVGEGAKGVRHDKVIAAWGVRRRRTD